LQSLANQVDTIADFDALSGRRSLAIDFDMPTGYGSRCTAPGLEEPAAMQPAVNA
jgi:hypothetical protein